MKDLKYHLLSIPFLSLFSANLFDLFSGTGYFGGPLMNALWVLVFGVIGIGGFCAERYERWAWNDGICAATGRPWCEFDMDSQGGRGYHSRGQDGQLHTLWVSCPYIDDGA